MRVSDLIDMASWYFKRGIMVALIMGIGSFIGYYGVYRKLLRGQKKIGWKKLMWWGIFICYLCVVLGATLLSRGNSWSNSELKPLFYSYKDAWISFSNVAWRNIILNYCMFIPFGFWLPLGIKRLRRFWKVYLAGFVFSLSIECTQLFLQYGIFEADDILGNTVGTMIGYGLFAIVFFLVDKRERTRRNLKFVVLLQTPLIVTVAVFGMIFWRYDRQELGNNPYRYLEAYDSAKIHVTEKSAFSIEENDLEVYEAGILTVEAAKEKGERIFEALGTVIDESRTDVYDETIVLYSESGSYSLWIDYQGGTFEFSNFDLLFPENHDKSEPVTGAGEAEIRDALYAAGFEVPEEADFMELESGRYLFKAAMSESGQGIVNGTLTCRYFGEGKGIGEVSNQLIECTPYKSYRAISEQEASERIARGEFAIYRGDEYLEIRIESCSLVYALDSKGYFQPNYQFECIVNGEEWQIMIPAIEN